MTFTTFVVIWFVLGIVTAALALYRKLVSQKEEDYIHLGPGQERMISEQTALAKKMDVIDRWGKTLTAITVVFGLVLAGGYLYQAWIESVGR